MPNPLVECIPNFSEGRRPEVIQAIEDAIRGIAGVQVLDRHTDGDHNRTVITFVGPPEAAGEAAFAAIARAAELIDLDEHRGEHPRLGATDVVPFVPLQGVTMEECVELARRLGSRVGEELEIPVYLYEAAASRPDRVNLEDIRRGEYEGLKRAIATDPDRAPDFGPARVGKAGATVVGARPPLIAFNVYLASDDVEVAKKVARAVRHSSGGLRYVKALGLLVEGRAQVSMNLTDFTRTPLARVVELIRREAARYGAAIHHTELVGLIPQAALVDAAQWYLQLDAFEPDQVLETRLYAAGGGASTEAGAFLDRLAAGTPAPGGGSAAAYAGAMGAALAAMVARLTIGKKGYTEVQERVQAIAAEADRLRADLAQAVRRDAEAFSGLLAARRMPKTTAEEQAARAEATEAATRAAAEVPLQVAGWSAEVMALAAEVAEIGNANALSDAASAAALARAALIAAGWNVRVNAHGAADRAAAEDWLRALADFEARAASAEERARRALERRGDRRGNS